MWAKSESTGTCAKRDSPLFDTFCFFEFLGALVVLAAKILISG